MPGCRKIYLHAGKGKHNSSPESTITKSANKQSKQIHLKLQLHCVSIYVLSKKQQTRTFSKNSSSSSMILFANLVFLNIWIYGFCCCFFQKFIYIVCICLFCLIHVSLAINSHLTWSASSEWLRGLGRHLWLCGILVLILKLCFKQYKAPLSQGRFLLNLYLIERSQNTTQLFGYC